MLNLITVTECLLHLSCARLPSAGGTDSGYKSRSSWFDPLSSHVPSLGGHEKISMTIFTHALIQEE